MTEFMKNMNIFQYIWNKPQKKNKILINQENRSKCYYVTGRMISWTQAY